MADSQTLQRKLDRLEMVVDALVEERNGLRNDLLNIEKQFSRGEEQGGAPQQADPQVRTLDSLRSKLAESDAKNQQLVRERNQVRERLAQIKNRLDQVEAKLLEQRS